MRIMIDAFYGILESLGFSEPLHAPITHMPIGLVVGALIFLVVALVFRKSNLVHSARHASILAFIFVFPTILFGVFDWMHFYKAALMPAIQIKMALAAAVLVLLAAGIILGSEIKLHNTAMLVIYALSFAAVIGLGYFGAGIIYGRGVAPAAGSAAAQAAPAAESGQAVFAANCQSCHANGGNAVAPAQPLKTSRQLAGLEVFSAFIRDPRNPDGSRGAMPAFSKERISDGQAAELLLFINSKLATWK